MLIALAQGEGVARPRRQGSLLLSQAIHVVNQASKHTSGISAECLLVVLYQKQSSRRATELSPL